MAEIQFWHSLGGPPQVVLETIVNRYNENHKDCPVHLNYVALNGYEAAVTEALALEPIQRPNLVLAPEFMTGKLKLVAQEGGVMPLPNLLNQEKMHSIAEIVRKTFGEYSLPLNPACGVLYVNENALKGIEYDPKWRPSSLEELKEACRLMIDKKVVEYGWSTAWPEAYLVEVVLAQRNLPLVTPNNGEKGYGTYNLSQLKDHIFELWTQCKDKIFLPPATGNYDPSRIPFTEGKVGFYMQGSGHAGRIAGEADSNWVSVGFSALPTLAVGHIGPKYAFPLGGAAVWALNPVDIKAYGPDQIAAERMIDGVKDFLNYLASADVQEEWHKETGYVPVSKDVFATLKESGFYTTHPVHEAVVEQTLNGAVGDHSTGIKMPNYGEARKDLYPILHALLHLSGSPEVVKKEIETTLKAFDLRWSIPKPGAEIKQEEFEGALPA